MAGLTRAQVERLTQLLRDRAESRISADSPLAHWLLADYADLCRVQGKNLLLSPAAKQHLRVALAKSIGSDLFRGLPQNADRIATSAVIPDEKLADIRPDQNHVWVSSLTAIPLLATATLSCETVLIPKELSVRIPQTRIDLQAYAAILVIENLNVFDHWYAALLPAGIGPLLIAYRGHDRTERALKSLLNRSAHERPEQFRIAFTDIDPAGLHIIYSSLPHTTHWLVPEPSRRRDLCSKSTDFVKQHMAQHYLSARPTDGWQAEREWILNEKIAISQESLIAHQIPLILSPRHGLGGF